MFGGRPSGPVSCARAPKVLHQTCYAANNSQSFMSHSYSKNYIHAVFSTKDRQSLIPAEFEKRLYPFLAAIAREHEIPLLAAGGMQDHSHLLFRLPASVSLASAIGAFKANSSRFLHEQGLAFEWQSGYGAFSVSPSQLDKVMAYVSGQREHHTQMTYEQEFLALLKKAGVEYDPQYVFG
jgi:REP element-mobilizing transposase RayT